MKNLLLSLVMLASMNASAQWVQTNGPYEGGINCFAVLGTKIFVGTSNYAGSSVHLSTNNGNNWLPAGLTNREVKTLCFKDDNLFAGTNNGVLLSTNDGTNWVAVNNGLTDLSVRTMIRVGTNLFIGTQNGGGIFLSTNNGANWVAVNNGLPTWSRGIWAFGNIGNDIYAGTSGGIYLSTNNGSNWNDISNGLQIQTVSKLCVSGSNIFAGSYEGLFLSTNNGTNWTAITNGLENQIIACLTLYESSLFVGTFGGVFSSTNNGTNWFQKNQGFIEILPVYALVVNNNYIFAGVANQYVYRRNYSEITRVQNISSETPSKYSLFQNYPNPFNPVTKIKFEVPKQTIVEIKVFDILGREIKILMNENLKPGTYETSFDGTQFSSGIYFYRMIIRHGGSSTDGYTETKKMLLIK